MTSTEIPWPDNPLEAIGANGAFQIGDGFKFGQDFTEGIIRTMFRVPAPTPEGAIELLREYLQKLPLEVLQAFKDLIPDSLEEQFSDVVTSVNTIIDSLIDRPWDALLKSLKLICEFLSANELAQCIAALVEDTGSFAENFVRGAFLILEGLSSFLTDNPLINSFKDLVDDTGVLLLNIVSGAVEALQRFMNLIGFANPAAALDFFDNAVTEVWELLSGAVAGGAKTLEDIFNVFSSWVDGIPALQPFIEAITGLASITDLAGLSEWIRTNLLTIASKIPSTQLFGQIPSILLGVIPVSNINDTIVNLVEGEFADGAGLSELQGWEWDDTESATSGSGSAKVICDGNNKELFFQTPVRVAPGDRLTMSTKVKTSLASLPGSQQRLGLWVLNYKGNALGENLPVATRSTGTTSWVEVSGNYTVPAGVTSLIIRLAVEGVAYNGGYVWFDDVDVHKSGSIAQEWVGNLTDTWEGVWTGAFGTSGSGKKWFDVGPALTSMTGKTTLAQAAGDGAQGNVQTTWNDLYDGLGRTSGATGKTSADVRARGAATREQADLGVLNAETADGKARAVATGIANTVGGLPGTTGVPTSITTYFTSFFNKLYGAGRSTPQTTISGDAISTVSATKIDGQIGNGQIANNAVTTAKLATGVVADIKSEVAAATVGSGAMLVRKGTATQGATPTNRNKFTVGFFTDLVLSSPDITAVKEPLIFQGVNYGNFYNGTFQVANAGWYMVEVAFRVNSGFSAGFNVAPVLYRNGVAYKIGTDIIQTATRTSRYVQNSWIVYLAAGQNVGGGYDSSIGGSGINFFAADDTGIETYISISLLNRSLN